ncbi:MAG: hypothetical protein HRT91_03545 [Piscirickettsiaceae bacterium]|nr:hypothetical protein [Piscirickettsiaceae bacterium]
MDRCIYYHLIAVDLALGCLSINDDNLVTNLSVCGYEWVAIGSSTA